MATKKSMWFLFGILAVSVWVLAYPIQAGAETMNCKVYTWAIKKDSVPVGDVEGHDVGYINRGAFYVFDSGEVASINHVATFDAVKGSGPFLQYVTVKFEDASTITFKSQGTVGGAAAQMTSEIIKGTGRFEGIKGTQSAKVKYLPLEKGEPGPRGYGSASFIYTLPPK